MQISKFHEFIDTLKNRNPVIIESTPTEPKRASVGILLRIRNNKKPLTKLTHVDLDILYIRRAYNPKDRWASHMAFPGGKTEINETDKQSCEREWKEEVGIDLQKFEYLGRLDDRQVKQMASSKRVMVLCSFVYLQVIDTPLEFIINPAEISSIYWIPCEYLVNPNTKWDAIPFDISRHVSQKVPHLLQPILSIFCGQVLFFGIKAPLEYRVLVAKEYEIQYRNQYPIWGLTLWMTSDLLAILGHVPVAKKGGPRYSAIDVDWFISLLSGKKRTLETFLHRDKIKFGLSTVHAVRLAVTIGLTARVIIIYQVSKVTLSSLRKLIKL
jgi:8-oxo-dGTP pyrophosphatase MutT (NUDIX family)